MPTPITPIGATTPAAAATSAEKPSALSALNLDSDAFLKLLVAQLKYQNPMDPMDPTAMMAQTAQLAVVDRMNQMVKSQTASEHASQVSLAASLVGKTVTYRSAGGFPLTGTVGSVNVSASDVTINIGTEKVALSDLLGVGAGA